MSETLQMIFANTDGRNSSVAVTDPQPGISALEVEEVMDSIIDRNIFATSGGDLERKVRAQVVSRTVTVLNEF